MSFDLETRPVAMPWHMRLPVSSLPEPPVPPAAPPAPAVITLPEQEAPSYWVRRRRQQALAATKLDD